MNSNNKEPFAIGQRVVAIKDSGTIFNMLMYKKGDEFTVVSNKRAPQEGSWHTSFVERPADEFYDSSRFAPIQTDRIRYVAVAEEVKEMEVCHN